MTNVIFSDGIVSFPSGHPYLSKIGRYEKDAHKKCKKRFWKKLYNVEDRRGGSIQKWKVKNL